MYPYPKIKKQMDKYGKEFLRHKAASSLSFNIIPQTCTRAALAFKRLNDACEENDRDTKGFHTERFNSVFNEVEDEILDIREEFRECLVDACDDLIEAQQKANKLYEENLKLKSEIFKLGLIIEDLKFEYE